MQAHHVMTVRRHLSIQKPFPDCLQIQCNLPLLAVRSISLLLPVPAPAGELLGQIPQTSLGSALQPAAGMSTAWGCHFRQHVSCLAFVLGLVLYTRHAQVGPMCHRFDTGLGTCT